MVERLDAADLHPSGSGYRASAGARVALGIAAGIVGGIFMMEFMMIYASVTGAGATLPLRALGAFVYGVEALVAGPSAMFLRALIQLGFSIVLGILFAPFASRNASWVAALSRSGEQWFCSCSHSETRRWPRGLRLCRWPTLSLIYSTVSVLP